MNTVEYLSLILSILAILGSLIKILKGFHKVIDYIEAVHKTIDVVIPALSEKIDSMDKTIEKHDIQIKGIYKIIGSEKKEDN